MAVLHHVTLLFVLFFCVGTTAEGMGRGGFCVPTVPPGWFALGHFDETLTIGENELPTRTSRGWAQFRTHGFFPNDTMPAQFNIEVWAYATDDLSGGTYSILSWQKIANSKDEDNMFWLGVRNRELVFQHDGAELGSNGRHFLPGTWHHISVHVENTTLNPNYEAKKVIVYVDGNPWIRGEIKVAMHFSTLPMFAGRYTNDQGTYFWPGFIDEIRIWDRCRNQSEVEWSSTFIPDPGMPHLIFHASFEDHGALRISDGKSVNPLIQDTFGSIVGTATYFSVLNIDSHFPSQTESCEPICQTSVVTGLISDTFSGAAIPNAVLECRTAGHVNEGIYETASDDNGEYKLNNLEQNTYICNCSADGYTPSHPQIIGVENCKDRHYINCPLQPLRGSLFGVVKECDRNINLVGIPVTCTITDSLNQTTSYSALTDQVGSFDFETEARGSFVCVANATDLFNNVYGPIAGVFGVQSGQDQRVDICFEASTLTVNVTRCETGEPEQGVRVSVTGPRNINRNTNRQGLAIFRNLLPGPYVIDVSKEGLESPTPLSLIMKQGTPVTVDRCLSTDRPPARCLIFVRSNNRPVENAYVECRNFEGGCVNGTTDASGQVVFETFVFGFTFCTAQLAGEGAGEGAGFSVEGETKRIDIFLDRRERTSCGLITDCVTGFKLPGTDVRMFSPSGSPLPVANNVTDNEGQFCLTSIFPETYRMHIDRPAYNLFDVQGVWSYSQPCSYAQDPLWHICLGHNNGTVFGEVRDGWSNQLLIDAVVELVRFNPVGEDIVLGRIITNGNVGAGSPSIGSYQFENVDLVLQQNGVSHRVRVVSSNVLQDRRAREDILVNSPLPIQVSFQIMPVMSGSITGFVFDTFDRTPIPGARVFATNNPIVVTTTDRMGKYRLDGLPLGQQSVSFEKEYHRNSTVSVNIPMNGLELLPDIFMESSRIFIWGSVLAPDGVTAVPNAICYFYNLPSDSPQTDGTRVQADEDGAIGSALDPAWSAPFTNGQVGAECFESLRYPIPVRVEPLPVEPNGDFHFRSILAIVLRDPTVQP